MANQSDISLRLFVAVSLAEGCFCMANINFCTNKGMENIKVNKGEAADVAFCFIKNADLLV